MARPAPPPIDVTTIAAAEAIRWQWLIDAHAHLDECIDELKREMASLAIWKKNQELQQAHSTGISQGRASILMFFASCSAITAFEVLKPFIEKLVGL